MPGSPRRLAPRKEPSQARSRDMRDRILRAAARVFAEHGYAAGTTNRIADEAGCSVGSLYQYFPNKDAILLQLAMAHVDDGVARLQHRLEDLGTLPDALESLVRQFVGVAIDAHREDRELHRVLFEESPRPPALLDRVHDLEATAVAVLSGVLADHPEVHVADPEMASWIALATVESLTHRYMASRVDIGDLAAFEDEVVSLVTAYLRGDAVGGPSPQVPL